MKSPAKYLLVSLLLLSPALASAQSVGQVACARPGDYTYLYSSMTTLDVLRTLQCGEQLEITGRYDAYFGVRTAKGEAGYVPQASVLLFKDKPGPRAAQPATPPPVARARTAYDEPVALPPARVSAVPAGFDLTLPNATPVHVKLIKVISSATAKVGEVVEFEVSEDVLVDGIRVIPIGAKAAGTVTEAEPKKRMGHGGKLTLAISFILLANNEKAAVRSFLETTGASNAAGSVLPLAHGKDVVFTEGTVFTAFVDGDVYLKRSAFPPAKDTAGSASAAQSPSRPPIR
ncbi:MAG TPA: hypothetical protein VH114_08370 [Candidatus Acidoferrum sp.]|jgi:hypothetical protein|nr:hypothetical protein [Candidatus Acidoferrum sp.]